MKKTNISNISNSVITTGNVTGNIKNRSSSGDEPETIVSKILFEKKSKVTTGKILSILLLILLIVFVLILKFG